MKPVELEIIMRDSTRQGMQSVEKNINGMESQMQEVISILKKELVGLQNAFKNALSHGVSNSSDLADIQALKGKIVELEEELKKLKTQAEIPVKPNIGLGKYLTDEIKAMENAEDRVKAIIANIQQDINALRSKSLETAATGVINPKDAAEIKALEAQVRSLTDTLGRYDVAKRESYATPVIDEHSVTRQTNNLKLQFSQVARELPALAMGPQMFILAISNNLPMLADAVKNVREQNELLAKSGQKSTSVWKQLLSAAGSWQTMLVVGITLLTVYGKEIWEWTKGLFGAKDAILDLSSAENEMALARQKASESIKKEQTELAILYSKLKNTAITTKERIAATNEWIKRYPEYANILSGENLNLGKLETAYKALSKEIYANAVARHYADKIGELSVKQEKEEIKRLNQKLTVAKAEQEYERLTAEYNKKKEQGFGSATAKLDAANKIELARRNVEEQKKIYNDLIENVNNYGKNITTISNHIQAADLFPQPQEGTYDYWKQQQENAEGVLKEIKSNVKRTLDDAAKEGKDLFSLGIDMSVVETYKKAVSEVNEAKKQLKIYDDKDKETSGKTPADYQNELADARVRARQKMDAAYIAVMNEGREKRKAIAKKEYDENLAAINKEERDTLTKQEKSKKAGNKVTPEEVRQVKNDAQVQRNLAMARYMKDTYDIEKDIREKNRQEWVEYNKEYGTYQEKRLAIEVEFDSKLTDLMDKRRDAEKKGETDTIAALDIAIAKATKDKGKALINLDYEQLKQSPDYIRAFENLRETSSETLNSLLNQFEKAKSTAAQVLSPDQLREYTTTIQEIMDELDSRNPFQTLIDRKAELAEAEKALAEAKAQLDAVQKRDAKIETGAKHTRYNEKTGKIESEKTYLSATEALKKYNEMKDKAVKANAKVEKAEKEVEDVVAELSGAIKEVGNSIGGSAGEIISLIGDIGLFAMTTMEGIDIVSKKTTTAIQAVEKASVILSIISAAIQILQKISELGNNKAFKQYEAYAEKLKEINALTDAVNQYRVAALEAQQAEAGWFSDGNLQSLRDYRKLHDEVAEAYIDKAMESQAAYKNESGGGWLTGAINWVMGNMSALSWWDDWKDIWGQGDYDKGQTAAINNLRIETRKKSSGFLGSGIGGKSQKTEDLVTWARNQGLGELFDDEGMINKELAQSLIDNYGNKLVGETKETLESLIELRKKYDEYIQQLHEYVSSLYEPLVDNFVDSLWDWFDTGKDALDSFKDYASDTFRNIVSDMLRTIVLQKVVGTFSDDISALYEKYAKGAITEEELMKLVAERTSGLVGDYEKNIPTLEGIMTTVNDYFKKAGIDLKQPDSSGSSQSGHAGAITTVTEETAGKLEGIGNSIQTHVISMDDKLTDISQCAYEAIGVLGKIAENTAYCKYLEQLADDSAYQRREGTKLKG